MIYSGALKSVSKGSLGHLKNGPITVITICAIPRCELLGLSRRDQVGTLSVAIHRACILEICLFAVASAGQIRLRKFVGQ